MNTRNHEPARALLALAINAALALGWNAAVATAPAVTNCNSSGSGSLAAAVADPMTADGDVIDMTGLKNVCSKITLDDLAIHKDVILEGPGAKYLTLDGANSARVFHHDGMGTLAIAGVTLANGTYSSASKPKGGCGYSTGSISLIDTLVRHCKVTGTDPANAAMGGALYTKGDLHLLRSTITDSTASGEAGVSSHGGAAYAKNGFSALYSTIERNTAETATGMAYALGGGISTPGDVTIANTTISANRADIGGGLRLSGGMQHVSSISDSTVSGNIAAVSTGGLWNKTALTISNSTLAFNLTLHGSGLRGAAVYTATPLTLESSIIAGNGGSDGANDLAGGPAATASGADNLVFKSSLMLPMNTTTGVCPKLDVLADNGGPTPTHGLKSTSPAIDKGSAAMSLTIDQRLAPRVTGMKADIGAVEYRQADELEGVFVGGFDGLCDR